MSAIDGFVIASKPATHFGVGTIEKLPAIVRATGADAVVVVTDADGPSAPQTFVFSDENTMQWTIVPGKRISFRREK